jgi:hypothetical protein
MFCILERNPPQAAFLSRSNSANFSTCGEYVDSTNEYIKIVLVLGNIPIQCRPVLASSRHCSSALMAVSCRRRKSTLCCFKRDLFTVIPIFVLTLAMESSFMNTCDMAETQRRRFGGEKSCKRDRAGISKLFLCGVVMEVGTQSLGGGARGHTVLYARFQTIYPNTCFFSRGARGDHPQHAAHTQIKEEI